MQLANKNLLIFLGEYNGYINANKRIALTIEKELRKLGYNSYFACVNYFQSEEKIIDTDGISIRVFPSNIKYASDIKKYNDYKDKLGAKKCLINHPILTIKNQLIKKNIRCDLIVGIKKMLEEINSNKLLCFYYPFAPTYSLVTSDIDCEKYVCQLDPWGLHEDISEKVLKKRIKDELYMFSFCKHIFTTEILYKEYLNHEMYSVYSSKMSPMKFPNISPKDEANQDFIRFDDNCCNIVFLGILDDSYRNPKLFLDFVLKSKENIRLFFIGKNHSFICKEYGDKYPDKISAFDPVSSDVANGIMMEDIFLLNINNTYHNQLPSKVLDYISSGTPIINVIKNEDDFSLSLLDKYDNKYNFFEYQDNDINEFDEFLVKCKGKKVPFERISVLYKDYTPEAVGRLFANRLK